jgi:hypothetical protein
MGSAAVQGRRWSTGPHGWGGCGNFGIVSRFEFTRYPVLAIPGGPCNQDVRPAR